MLAQEMRGQGLAQSFLRAIVSDLAARGVKHVQGFPKTGENLEPGDAWTGTESIFRAAGFALEREAEKYPVYGLNLAAM